MASQDDKRQKFITLLHALFQLDQPDLDFGFYRIMHAKAGQVSKFLEEDLLGIIHDAFGQADEVRIAEAKATWQAARQQAADYGAPDPDATEPVKKAKAAYDAAKDVGNNESDVYDHLYRFFERYYDNGDFMSRRYFARETDGKAAPYAVPYDGREVYLHWANRDQYYIKTSEYLSNFSFDPTQAKAFEAHFGAIEQTKPLKVHCRIVAASEGEHNNVKASEQTERYFIIHESEPVKIETSESSTPELVIQFQYRADPEKTGQESSWRKKRLAEAAETITAQLSELEGADEFAKALAAPAPTEAEKDRTLLEKYLAQYTARNTMDYFIHKDLGGFLRRELDFYIKNEVMRLDDIEAADAPRVETYLAKVKVLRKIGRHLIDFLAQMEDFQKKLWLKKKFVVDTQYCITLDRIPESFYDQIVANEQQWEQWDSLGVYPEGTKHTVHFLRANPYLVVDTGLFDADFQARLVSGLEQLDEQCDGVLVHSNNLHGLSFLAQKYKKRFDSIYIDPPYNTGVDDFIYRDNYRSSSWLSATAEPVLKSLESLSKDGILFCSIDDCEMPNLTSFMDACPQLNLISRMTWKSRQFLDSRSLTRVSNDHEYLLIYGKSNNSSLRGGEKDKTKYSNPDKDPRGKWMSRSILGLANEEQRPNLHYSITDGVTKFNPPSHTGWRYSQENMDSKIKEGRILFPAKPDGRPREKVFLSELKDEFTGVSSVISQIYTSHGSSEIRELFRNQPIQFPKPTKLIEFVSQQSQEHDGSILDFYAGSGTTGHAVINLNRNDGGNRKYLLIEMADHFDTVLKPRLQKAVFAEKWKNGRPTGAERTVNGEIRTFANFEQNPYNGISHCFKYIRLESYEDALANLRLDDSSQRTTAIAANPAFKQDYMLHYWLNFETKGSPSLLNIEQFNDPTAYKLKIKQPGTDEYTEKAVDLVETFNWLIGLHVQHLDHWRGYTASFKREIDPELPEDTNTRLMLDGALQETDDGAWRLRKVEGYTLRTPGDQNDREKVLVIWRKLTGDLEQDNLMLDEWFLRYRMNSQDSEFDVIYVNGSNNLLNLRQAEETWQVRLIEEAFHQAMWDVED